MMNTEKIRIDLASIFDAGIRRVDPYGMIKNLVTLDGSTLLISSGQETASFDLSRFNRIVVLGAGKATAKMALAVEEILSSRIDDGLIAVKRGHTASLSRIRVIEAGHPVPDENSVKAAREIAKMCVAGDERTLYINLISGGGSSLLSYPLEIPEAGIAITLSDKQETTRLLLSCGAAIQEINCIRKHISGIKGGRLAKLMYPSTSVNLILSDVVGDRLDSIASGLTVPDGTTYKDALDIFRKYGIDKTVPRPVFDAIAKGAGGEIPETPEHGDPAFGNVHTILVGTNFSALLACEAEAKNLGYNTLILSSQVTGEARDIASVYRGIARDILKYDIPVKRPACVIAGGETTVTIRGKGLGGRNQEMALAFLSGMGDDPVDGRIFFLSAATDGNDGPTDAAGAFADGEASAAARAAGLDCTDYLLRNDSYTFFDRIGLLLRTGPTNTNVCDIQLLIVH